MSTWMDFIHAHFGDTGPVLTSVNTTMQVNHQLLHVALHMMGR